MVHEARRRSVAHVLVDDVVSPAPAEATWHHLRRVLRVRDGEAVTVTDGAGRWRLCRFTSTALAPDGDVEVEVPPAAVTVLVAPPKGDRAEWLVQKCTEVGADRIVFVDAERSVVRWDGQRAGRHLDRLRRVAVEASMQSRRVWLPELSGPVPAREALVGTVAADPAGRAVAPGDTSIAVGPEGGWSPAELAVAGGSVSLGPNVLRVETAAVVATALMVAGRAPEVR